MNKAILHTSNQMLALSKIDANSTQKQKLIFVVIVFLCALCLRLVFIYELLYQDTLSCNAFSSTSMAGFLTNDSAGYITLSKNFFSNYFGPQARWDALMRSPGYPAFCAVFYSLGISHAGVLVSQAVLASIIPVLTMMLAHMFSGRLLLGVCAGLLSAFSPTGIGLGGLIMSDMLFSVVLIGGLFCLCHSAHQAQGTSLVLSGLLFGAAFLVKPILVFWPICMVAVYYLFCRAAQTKPNMQKLIIAVLIQLVLSGIWCTRNYVYDGIFTPSSVSTMNLHNYVRPRVEEWVKAGKRPRSRSVRNNRDELVKQLSQKESGLSSKERLQTRNARAMDVFKAYPLTTAKVIMQNSFENMISGWDYLPRQLPFASPLQRILTRGVQLEKTFRKISLFSAMLFFLYLSIRAILKNTDAEKKYFFSAAALVITCGYFALLAGTTFFTGSRIMYPVEFILIVLICMAFQEALRVCIGIFKYTKKYITKPVVD